MDTVARRAADGVSLVKTFEDLPEFEEVFLMNLTEQKDGVRCRYRMVYEPAKGGALEPAQGASPAGGEADLADADPEEEPEEEAAE
jgi:hypothetical protein